MVNISVWTEKFVKTLEGTFPGRVCFVGLQGSYSRGEATDTSDIDVVVILDELHVPDIQAYNKMLDTLPYRDLICGFLSGKNEILNWEVSDLFQFCYDTTPIIGNLDEILILIDSSAVDRAIKIGSCNIYHACVHNMLHEKSDEILKTLYKSASFVVQAIVFKQKGRYIRSQTELLGIVSPDEKNIINTFLGFKSGKAVDFENDSRVLFDWVKNCIQI